MLTIKAMVKKDGLRVDKEEPFVEEVLLDLVEVIF